MPTMQKRNKKSSSRSYEAICFLSVVALQFKERTSALCAVSQGNKNIWKRPHYSLNEITMFDKYSGTFFAVIAMIAVPQLIQLGFSQSCSEEIATYIGTGIVVLLMRYMKGGVNIAGVRK